MGKKGKAWRLLTGFTEDDKELLVRIVKSAQGHNTTGSKGDWETFLRATQATKSPSSRDPAKYSWTTLAAFVSSFTSREDVEMVTAFRNWQTRKARFEELEEKGNWKRCREQDLVRRTFEHWQYKDHYTLPSTEEGWILTDSKAGETNRGKILSVDCEMVDCEGGKELARVCVLDNSHKAVLDMLVKPRSPVIDYLTSITGISKEELDTAKGDFYDAQAAVLELLSSNTILVGHSLHNDLKALKIDHLRLIDSAYIFQYHNKRDGYNIGLRDLCKVTVDYVKSVLFRRSWMV